jgi:uncharacterized protein
MTALEQAIRDGDAAAARSLLAADPALAGSRAEDGLPLVLLALFHQQDAIRDALLAAGPRLGVLELAALGEAELLAEQVAADPQALELRTPDGFDALALAAFFGGAETVETLLDLGVDPDGDDRNRLHVRPLHAAAAAHDRESLRLLLDHGADPNARQQGGFTALHAAAHANDATMAALLLAHGADPSLTTDEGEDAAAIAERQGATSVAALLGG